MEVKVSIQQEDIKQKFGQVTIEELAAAMYNAFHGHCECSSHPFTWDDNGDFHGKLPWNEGHPEKDDVVVQAFRYAAMVAREAMKTTGVGHIA